MQAHSPKMPAIATPGPGQRQEFRTQSGSPRWMAGTWVIACCFPGHTVAAWVKLQPGQALDAVVKLLGYAPPTLRPGVKIPTPLLQIQTPNTCPKRQVIRLSYLLSCRS